MIFETQGLYVEVEHVAVYAGACWLVMVGINHLHDVILNSSKGI